MTDNDIRLTLTRGEADAALSALSQLAADPVLNERMSNAERMAVASLYRRLVSAVGIRSRTASGADEAAARRVSSD